MNRLTDNLKMVQVLGADIGGTNATSDYVSLADYDQVVFDVMLGFADGDNTYSGWTAADKLDSLIVKQAINSSGGSVKTLKDHSANAVVVADHVAGTHYQIVVNADELDVANDFTHVAVYVAESDDGGTDYVVITAVAAKARFANENESGLTAATYVLES